MAQMAIPLIIAAAGAGLQYAGGQQAKRSMNNAASAELDRQRNFQNQSNQVVASSIQKSGSGPGIQDINSGAKTVGNEYQRVQQVPSQTNSIPVATPDNKFIDTARQAATNQSNSARSQLFGYNQWLLNQQIADARAKQQLGIISGNARGSEGVLPLELQAASHAGDGFNAAGQVLGTLGQVYGAYTGLKAPATSSPSFASTFDTTPATGGGWYQSMIPRPPTNYFDFGTSKF